MRKNYGKKTAISLVEMIVVIGILLIVSALLFPVFVRSRKSAHITRSMSNLRQIGQALALYQGQDSDASPQGSYTAMGLPENPDLLELPDHFWKCEDGGANSIGGLVLMYTNQPPAEKWEEYTARVGSSAIAVADLCWDNPTATVFNQDVTHFGLGVHLDTHVSKRWKKGDWTQFSWWD